MAIDTASATEAEADFEVGLFGSIATLTPLNGAAREWLDDAVATEGWQWYAGGLAVEQRLLWGLLDGLQADGFRIR